MTSALLTLAFFLSGVAGLAFETLWLRSAGLLFGNSVWAASLVLSSFMGGLALGNAVAARHGARVRHPIRAYALLELVVAGTGALLVVALPHLPRVFAPWFAPLLDSPWVLNPLRFGLAFVLLAIPTTAMGMTLPLMVKALHRHDIGFGAALGRLYGINTLGAMAGALAGEWVLLPTLGVTGSALAAAGLNLVAAGGAITASHLAAASASSRPPDVEPAARRSLFPLPMDLLRLLGVAFLAGGLLLSLEVVWFRFLQLFVLSTTRGFAIMLVVVLLGIGLGGLLSEAWLRLRPHDYRHVSHLAVVAGLLAMWSYIGFQGAPTSLAGTQSVRFAETLLLCLRLMLPVSLVSGVLFTFVGRAVFQSYGEETGAVGWATLFNTAGAAGGAIAGGWILIPALGVETSIFVLSLGYGAAAFLAPNSLLRGSRPALQALAVLLIALAASAFLFPFGLMENYFVPLSTERYRNEETEIVAVREGLTEHIAFLRDHWLGEPYASRLVTNSFSMTATTVQAQRYMKHFAYWPMAFHPEPKRALLISYGLGITARALTDSAELERIDVVDISADIVAMSDLIYPDPEDRPLRDPRVHVYIEDGRFFLLTTEERYDIITGEPPPLMVAGVVNLYTQEYFELLRSRLRPGGYATYWLPIVHLAPDDARAVVRAFCNVFEDCSLWRGARLELTLVGSNGATDPIDPSRMERLWKRPEAYEELSIVGFESPGLLLATFVADASGLDEFASGVAPLTDDRPYRMGRDIADRAAFDERVQVYIDLVRDDAVRARYESSELLRARLPDALRVSGLEAFPYHSLVERSLNAGARAGLYFEELDHVLTNTELRTPALWLMGDLHEFSGVIERLAEAGSRQPIVQYHLGLRSLADRDYSAAAGHFTNAVRGGPSDPKAPYYRILALGYAESLEEAETAAQELVSADPNARSQDAFWEFCEARFGLARP